MRGLHTLALAAVLVMVLSPLAMAQSGVEAPATNAKINEAIANAAKTLKELQRDDGSWDDYHGYPGAVTALVVQALLLAGEPYDSSTIRNAIEALQSYRIEKTYARACRAMAYAALVKHYPKLRTNLAGDASWLARNQHIDGMWGYKTRRINDGRADNSNTQFAVIGLRDASLAGIEVRNSVWGRLHKHYRDTQLPDGGWSYRKPEADQEADDTHSQSSVTVTAPSLASLMIVNDELNKTSGCPCSGGRSSGRQAEEKTVQKGMDWLVDYFDGKIRGAGGESRWFTYFYYGLQRAAQASGLKRFGRHDWYKRGSSAMVSMSRSECLIKYIENIHGPDAPGNKDREDYREPKIVYREKDGDKVKYVASPESMVNVALGMIFLIKGNAPVYMNKLKYAGDWNRHRRDMALISQEVSKRLERPFRWQVVDIKTGAPEDWAKDSPLLYMSGEEQLTLSDDDKQQLKDFVYSGGTLLIESNCGNGPFMTQAREVIAELWPDMPLAPLPSDHPVYNCQLDVKAEGLLEGIDDGIRTFVMLTDKDLSCAWQMRQIAEQKPKFDLAINLYAYATDKAPPPSRLTETEKEVTEYRAAMEAWKKALKAERLAARREGRHVKKPPKPRRPGQQEETLEVDIKLVEPGPRRLVTVNLLDHEGNYRVALHYDILSMLIAQFQKNIGVTLAMGQALPGDAVAPGMPDVLLVRGDQAMKLTDAQKANLVAYMTTGGFVIAEASMGRKAFDESFRAFIDEAEGLELVPLAEDDPFLSGDLGYGAAVDGEDGEPVQGMQVTPVRFSRTIREEEPGLETPKLFAIRAGEKTVGYYSPLDLTYCSTGYGAYGIRGYDKNSALAILINMFLATTRG